MQSSYNTQAVPYIYIYIYNTQVVIIVSPISLKMEKIYCIPTMHIGYQLQLATLASQ